MGTFFEGKKTEFCKVKIPSNYISSAMYSEDGKDTTINSDIYGIIVKNIDLSSSEIVNQKIALLNGKGTDIDFTVIPTSMMTFDDEKEYAGEYKEINNSNHKAIYYVNSDKYSTEDFRLTYQINDDMLLCIIYEGPAAEELGLDQLAKNLYDLIEVIN